MFRKFLLLKINRFPLKSVVTCLCILAGASVFGINLLFTYDEALEQILMSIFCVCMLGICFSLGVLLINAVTAIFMSKHYNKIFEVLFDLDEEDKTYIEDSNIVEFRNRR